MSFLRIAFLTTDNREQSADYDCLHPHFGTAPEALLEGFALHPGSVEIHVISCSRQAMSRPEKLAENIWFHQPVVSKFGWGRTGFLGCGFAVRRLLRQIKPHLVHAQGTERDCAVSMMMSGFPGLLTIHGHMARIAELTGARFPSFYWMARNLEALALQRAHGVICITNYTRQRVSALSRQTWVLPNAVDSSFFEINSPATGRQLLCVAQVCPWKRQVELIEALDRLSPQERPELVFLGQAGSDDYSRRFGSLVAERDWCQHVGRVSRSELRDWLRRAAGLILPSIEDNCPMVVLEAMAAGVPVAASRIGGIPDLIDDGRTGYLFDPEDATAISEAICNWEGKRSELIQFAAVAREESRERFHPKSIAARHLEIYREVLKGLC